MLPALIAGGLGLLGGIISNRSNAKQAERQMDFQEEMSNTSYQRGVADMKAAGINPMLSAKLGGASAPPGAAAHMDNVAAGAVSSASSAVGMQAAQAQIDKTKADTELSLAQAKKVNAETLSPLLYQGLGEARHALLGQQGALTNQNVYSEIVRRALLEQQGLTEKQRTALTQALAGHENVKLDVANTAFQADVDARKARAVLMQLGIPQAQAGAKFYGSDLGEFNPFLRQMLEILRGVSSAQGVLRR